MSKYTRKRRTKKQFGGLKKIDHEKLDEEFWMSLFEKYPKKVSDKTRSSQDTKKKKTVQEIPGQINMLAFKDAILHLYYEEDICEIIKRIIPKYATNSDWPPSLCILMFLVGCLTKIMIGECNILVKGGKAVQIELSEIPQSNADTNIYKEIPEYVSNDVDITIVSSKNYSPRDIALQIGYFIQWVTTHPFSSKSPLFLIKDLPKPKTDDTPDVGSIVKISLDKKSIGETTHTGGRYVAMMDIGYVLPEKIFNLSDNPGHYITTSVHLPFKFKKCSGFFNVQRIDNLLFERIYYSVKYTSQEFMMPPKTGQYDPLPKFRETLKRSINALLFGLVVQNHSYPNLFRHLKLEDFILTDAETTENDAEMKMKMFEKVIDIYQVRYEMLTAAEKTRLTQFVFDA